MVIMDTVKVFGAKKDGPASKNNQAPFEEMFEESASAATINPEHLEILEDTLGNKESKCLIKDLTCSFLKDLQDQNELDGKITHWSVEVRV